MELDADVSMPAVGRPKAPDENKNRSINTNATRYFVEWRIYRVIVIIIAKKKIVRLANKLAELLTGTIT